jgi:flagellar basal-body rod protein FlgB
MRCALTFAGDEIVSITDLPLLGMLKTKMRWHQARQSVLAQNIANADTPGFRPSDLSPMNTRQSLRAPGLGNVAAARTHRAHIQGSPMGMQGSTFKTEDTKGWERTPAGNSVVLEEQMIKVSANQFDFQMASTLYARSLGLLKTAIGRS